MRKLVWIGVALWLAAPRSAHALVVVSVAPAAPSVALGGSVSVDLIADFSAPDNVLAWGLDLLFDPARVAVVETKLGPGWLAFATPDGDGLGGVGLAGVTGSGLLLATVTLEGLSLGVSELGLTFTTLPTPDLREGFYLDPTGVASEVVFQGATLEVVPEPGTALLGALAAAALRVWRPRVSTARRAAAPP